MNINNRRANVALGVVFASLAVVCAASGSAVLAERHYKRAQTAGYVVAVEEINKIGCRKIEEISGTNMIAEKTDGKPTKLNVFDSRKIMQVPTLLVHVSDKPCDGELDERKVKNMRDRATGFEHEPDTEISPAIFFAFFTAFCAFFSFKFLKSSDRHNGIAE